MLQMTLKAAREVCSLTLEQAAEYCKISTDTYSAYEDDPRNMPVGVICNIRELLKIPLDLIKLDI